MYDKFARASCYPRYSLDHGAYLIIKGAIFGEITGGWMCCFYKCGYSRGEVIRAARWSEVSSLLVFQRYGVRRAFTTHNMPQVILEEYY